MHVQAYSAVLAGRETVWIDPGNIQLSPICRDINNSNIYAYGFLTYRLFHFAIGSYPEHWRGEGLIST